MSAPDAPSIAAPAGQAPDGEIARYPRTLRVLHWALALAICLQIVLIFTLRRLQSVEYANIVLGLHRSCGTALWPASIQ